MERLAFSDTWRWLRLVACCSLILLLPGVGGNSYANSFVSPHSRGAATLADDLDLCALLPSGEGIEVNPGIEQFGGRFQSCQVEDNRPGDKSKFFVFSISRNETVDQARADFKFYDYENIPPGPHGEKWVPTTAFGDPGFAFEMAAVPPSDPSNPSNTQVSAKVAFARGIYRVSGDAGWQDSGNYTLNDAGEIRAIAVSVDGALNAAVGPLPADATPTPTATEVTIPGATATETPQAEVDFQVDHIEVVQVIQRQGNEIPLVAGKKTVVRVFVQANSKTRKEVSGVSASVFVWPEGKSEVEVQPANGPITVDVNAAPKRDQTDSSINFVIPSDLTAAGFFSVKVVVNPTHSVAETNYDNNDHREPFEFVQRNGLRIGFVRIGYKPPGTPQWEWPGANIHDYAGTMRKLFPAADQGIQYYELPWRVRAVRPLSTTDLGDDLNWTLREFYDRIEGDKPDMLIGWLPNNYANTLDFGGLAETVLSGQVARVALAVDSHSGYSSNHILPHEVAHNLGLQHTATKGDPGADCKLAPNDDPNYWPKEYNDSATTHEVGFDTTNMIAIPDNYYDLMSYCGDKRPWISPFHYKKLYDTNLRPQAAFVTDRGHVIWVRGWASVKGDAAQLELVRPPTAAGGGATMQTNAASGRYLPSLANRHDAQSFVLRPSSLLYAQSSVRMQREGSGNHCLRFLDAGGASLYERCFDLDFRSEETLAAIEQKGFALEIPDPGNVARAVLVRNENGQERELASVKASSHAPTLAITAPKAGDRWEGEHTVVWTGSDADGDSLRYDILYSADGKQSWYPLEVGSHETQYTFSTDEILPGEQTYVRVLASDGFNTTQLDVGPLVIPKQPNSPNPPPDLQPQPQPQPLPGPTTPSGGLDAIWLAVIGGTALMVVGGFTLLFVLMRRPRTSQVLPGMYGMPSTPTQPWNPPPNPAPPPHAPNAHPPAIEARFRWAEQEYRRLRGELAAGRIHPQQYQAMLGQLRVQDAQGRTWMLAPDTGQWLVYDGRGWVPGRPM